MADIYGKTKRSLLMSQVRAHGTRPELTVRQALRILGIRYRLNADDLPGRPDVVLARRRTAIFVHGCFWHRHPRCRKASLPATNVPFWSAKLAENVKRDQRIYRRLRRAGWTVLVVWECQTKRSGALRQTLARMIKAAQLCA